MHDGGIVPNQRVRDEADDDEEDDADDEAAVREEQRTVACWRAEHLCRLG